MRSALHSGFARPHDKLSARAFQCRHFSAEEGSLTHHPDFASHQYEHLQFIEKTFEFLKSYDEDSDCVGLRREIHTFLSRWLLNHTTGMDIDYFNEMREKGVLPDA